MVWPGPTIVVLVVLWGVWVLVDGVSSLLAAFQRGATGKVWLTLMGALSIVAGIIAIVHPGDAAVILTWVVGIWFIVRAVFEVAGASASTASTPRWGLLASAVLSLLIGLLFVLNPGTGVIAVALWLGLVAVIWGAVLVGVAIWVRGHVKDYLGTVNA